MKTMEQLYIELLADMKKEFPKSSIVLRKDVWWARLMDRFDKDTCRYATTIGITCAVPNDFNDWDAARKYRLIRHEYTHMKQQKRWGLGIQKLGFVVHGVLYLVCLIAVFTMRSVFEKEAYYQTCVAFHMAVILEHRVPTMQEYESSKNMILKNFCGNQYGWMCPFREHMVLWFEKVWNEAKLEAQAELQKAA